MRKIIVVGSANMDLVVRSKHLPVPGETLLGGSFSRYPGGKGANQAVAAARAGGQVSFIGCVGADEVGGQLLENLAHEGVDVKGVTVEPGSSGVALIMTAEGGDNMIVVAPGANDLVTADRVGSQGLDQGDIVLAQLEIPMDTIVHVGKVAQERQATFILDPAPAADLPAGLIELVDWITPNVTEARSLLGLANGSLDGERAARALQDRGARGVVLKLGAQGAILLESDGKPRHFPAHSVAVKDTTAAGDAFNGAFAVAIAEGASAGDAVRFAVSAAALAVTKHGAQPAMAYRDEIDALQRAERLFGVGNDR